MKRQVIDMALSAFLVFFVTLMLFPGLLTEVHPRSSIWGSPKDGWYQIAILVWCCHVKCHMLEQFHDWGFLWTCRIDHVQHHQTWSSRDGNISSSIYPTDSHLCQSSVARWWCVGSVTVILIGHYHWYVSIWSRCLKYVRVQLNQGFDVQLSRYQTSESTRVWNIHSMLVISIINHV